MDCPYTLEDGIQYHDAIRVLPNSNPNRPANYGPWMHTPNEYENSSDIDTFKEFCKVCNVEKVKYLPTVKTIT